MNLIEQTTNTLETIKSTITSYQQILDHIPIDYEFYNINTCKYYSNEVLLKDGKYLANCFKECTALGEERSISTKDFNIEGMLHMDGIHDTIEALRNSKEALNVILKNHDGNQE